MYGQSNSYWAYDTQLAPNQGPDCFISTGFGRYSAGSQHPGGAQILLCDGSVRFAIDSIDLAIWRNLGDKADGNVIGEF